jgi:hypothetical protein
LIGTSDSSANWARPEPYLAFWGCPIRPNCAATLTAFTMDFVVR